VTPAAEMGGSMDDRREKRNPESLQILLSSGSQPVVAEYASTENISACGARVQTERPWRPDTPVFVKSQRGEFWARARIVYCQTLQAKRFALGLQFLSHTGEWTTQG